MITGLQPIQRASSDQIAPGGDYFPCSRLPISYNQKKPASLSGSLIIAGILLLIISWTSKPATANQAEKVEPAAQPSAEATSLAESPTPATTPHTLLLQGGPEDMADLTISVRRFEMAARQYGVDLARIVEHRHADRKAMLDSSFNEQVNQLQAEEQARRKDAIAVFEAFLRKYPNHATYTPDALFRLAELYFEDSNDFYLNALESWENQLKDYSAGKIAQIPDEPVQNYDKTINAFERLIADFPQYHLLDGAYYLLGYCLSTTGEPETGAQSYQALVDNFPKSSLAAETWMRLGEYYFDYNYLEEAVPAYQKVLTFRDSTYYDRALYKLAWTYYRMNLFQEAIDYFQQIVLIADQSLEDEKKAAADLRGEAVQYIAVCIAEEDWDNDGEPDVITPVQRMKSTLRGEHSYEAEVIKQLADLFYDNTMYDQAASAYKYHMSLYPESVENPFMHEKVIASYERLRKADEAMAERKLASAMYQPDTKWRETNRKEKVAVKKAEELAEQSLYTLAVYYHTQAQSLSDRSRTLGDTALITQANQSYRQAADAYRQYLERYPDADNAYELGFFYAECLYFSGNYQDAAAQYKVVRDSNPDKSAKYLYDSALSTILAYENLIAGQTRQGLLPAKANPRAGDEVKTANARSSRDQKRDRKTPKGAPADDAQVDANQVPVIPQPEPVPALVLDLVAARDWYVEHALNSPDDPELQALIAFRSAEVFFKFNQLEEARTRFDKIVEAYPKSQTAVLAAGNIIESFRMVQNWEEMANWSAKFARMELGTADDRRKLREEVNTLQVGALFKQAEELFAQQKLEEAAALYIKLVNENPENVHADKALNNAAVANERLKKYDSAMQLYERIFRDYPDRPFAQQALYLSAINSERFFNFEKAIEYYLLYADTYPSSEQYATCIYRAALLLEDNQQYDRSAPTYELYANKFPNRDDAMNIAWRAAIVHEKGKNYREMERVLNQFIARYGKNASASEKVMEALDKLADAAAKRNDTTAAQALYQRILDEYKRRKLSPGTISATYAAKAEFLKVEREFEKFRDIKIEGNLTQQGKILSKLQTQTTELQNKYSIIFQFRSLDWTLAAYFRMAQILQLFAAKLYEAPIPGALANDPETADIYRMELEDLALPIEDQAMAMFEKTLDVARESRVVNEWTARTLEILNRYNPAKYPIFKEEKRVLAGEVRALNTITLPPPPPTPPPPPPEMQPAPMQAPIPVPNAAETPNVTETPSAGASAPIMPAPAASAPGSQDASTPSTGLDMTTGPTAPPMAPSGPLPPMASPTGADSGSGSDNGSGSGTTQNQGDPTPIMSGIPLPAVSNLPPPATAIKAEGSDNTK